MKKKDETLDWKKPTIERLQKMSMNLYGKYGGYATVQADAWAQSNREPHIQFWLSADGRGNFYYSWDDLLKAYRRIMYG